MGFLPAFFTTLGVFVSVCFALLEEAFVAFEPSSGAIGIDNAQILYSFDDFAGVRIAAESLASDFSEIAGIKPNIRNITREDLNRPVVNATSGSVIIVGSVNSSLIQRITRNGTNSTFSVQEIAGKWETFKTSIVPSPLPGISSALVIAGSDKRGTIFGIHTLAEQCGQSP